MDKNERGKLKRLKKIYYFCIGFPIIGMVTLWSGSLLVRTAYSILLFDMDFSLFLQQHRKLRDDV